MTEPERFYFHRFQKTGGTSLTLGLRREFGASAVYPRPEDAGHVEAVVWVDYLTNEFEEHRDELRVIAGHFPLCVLEVLDAPFTTFTILRDPVERTLSLLRSHAQRGAERFLGRPLEEIYEDPVTQSTVLNHMVKMTSLSLEEMAPLPLTQPVIFDQARLDRAKRGLAQIEVVGLQERYEEFCADVEARFGWDLGPRGSAHRTEHQSVSEAFRRRIAADNQMDLELYEVARENLGRPSGRPARPVRPTTQPKIVITGTGRAGTTVLVQILDELGLDTGLSEGRLSSYRPSARAGLESRVDDPDGPTIVKDMTLGFRMREVLQRGTVDIGHVVIPERRLDIAAASRIRAAAYGRRPFGLGALTGTARATQQLKVLGEMRSEIISALEDFEIPYTMLEFPRFATDAAYTHAALGPLVPNVTLEDVEAALKRCVHAELIHETPLSAGERWRTRLTTAFMVLYRYPVARVGRRINPEGQQVRLRAAVAAAREAEAALVEAERQAGRLPGQSGSRPAEPS